MGSEHVNVVAFIPTLSIQVAGPAAVLINEYWGRNVKSIIQVPKLSKLH